MAKSLRNFKEILFQKTSDPLANSRLAFEQLRKAVTDGSDLLVLMRQIRDEPSQIIDAILRLKAAAETKGPVVTIEAPKEVQPMLEKIFKRIEAARASVISAEKALGEVKEHLRNMQRECLQINNTKKEETSAESSKDERQLSLSQFKPEGE